MRYCGSCETVSSEGAFCSACGTETVAYQAPVTQARPPSPMRKYLSWAVAASASILALFAVGLLWLDWRVTRVFDITARTQGWDLKSAWFVLAGCLLALAISAALLALPHRWQLGLGYIAAGALVGIPPIYQLQHASSANDSISGMMAGVDALFPGFSNDVHFEAHSSGALWGTLAIGLLLLALGIVVLVAGTIRSSLFRR